MRVEISMVPLNKDAGARTQKNHLKIKYNQIDFNFELDPYLTNPKSHTKFHQATSSGSLDLWEGGGGGGGGRTDKERKKDAEKDPDKKMLRPINIRVHFC